MDLNTPIDINKDIENFIRKSKSNYGYIMADVLNAHAFNSLAKEKMFNYGLIKIDSEKPNIYHLTERGWNFESFEKEKQLHELSIRKSEIDLQNAERVYKTYRITRIFAWIGAISGVIALLIKLAESVGILHQ